jgi:diadenosine tetraphosphate (Ap4A) HIT family hydrolase
MTADCLICSLESADEADVVFRDEHWAAEIAPGHEVPGWLFLRVRRHAERLTGLSDAEVDGFGRCARDLVGALGEVLRTSVTYLLAFGENYPHFHALIVPRDDAVPAELRGGNIMGLRATHIDPDRARALIPALREAYARTATA